MIALVEVNIVSVAFCVPPLNSAAAPEAVMVMEDGVLGVVGATFITTVVGFVTELTVALFASPVPDKDMPFTSPAVLSQVTLVPTTVTQFVKVTPAAVSVSPEPLPDAGCERTKWVASVIRLTMVFPVMAPVVLPGMFGPVTSMPFQRLAVLAQVTLASLIVVEQPVNATGEVLLEVLTAWRIAPPPIVVHAFIEPVPFQAFDEVLLKTSRKIVELTGVPRLYVSCTWEVVAPAGAST